MKKQIIYNFLLFLAICLQLKGKTKAHGGKYVIYFKCHVLLFFFLFNSKGKDNWLKKKYDTPHPFLLQAIHAYHNMYCFYDGEQLLISSIRAKTYKRDRRKTRNDENRNKWKWYHERWT